MRRLMTVVACAAVMAVGRPVRAQAAADSLFTIGRILQVLQTVQGLDPTQLRDALFASLQDPATLNRGLEALEQGGVLNGLLRDLNLRFASLQKGDSGTVLGVTYDWTRDLKHDMLSQRGAKAVGINFTTSARGTVALQKQLNPRDFLDSKASLELFVSHGGVAPGRAAFALLNQLEDSLVVYKTLGALEQSPQFRSFFSALWSQLSTQYYVTVSGRGGLEADQSFSTKQYAYGANVGLDIKAWNPDSRLAQWNLFDWPAAAVRYLLGTDRTFRPSGVAIPTLVLGLDQVDPTSNPEREAVDTELAPYPRLRFEVAYRSILASTREGGYAIEAGIRNYRELGPSAAVEGADLANFTYTLIAITAPHGVYAAYSKGRLPFDRRSDQTYELGFRTNF